MIVDFYAFLAEAEQRRRDLGLTETETELELLRNKGSARTTAKRELLARTQARAIGSGAAMPRSHF
jgi:hypothetical protein